jgi:hypothetical protein
MVGPLSSVTELLRRFRINPAEVLTAAGLSATALDNPEATIPYADVGLLLEAAAGKTRCPYFGLEVGKQIRTTSLGLVGQLMRNAPTVGVALQDFVANVSSQNKCEYGLLRANSARTGAHYLRMNDGD